MLQRTWEHQSSIPRPADLWVYHVPYLLVFLTSQAHCDP
ncbi:hypothetical protein VD0001_g7583 [Verticillium dahliae]|nr:hypothetical protein VD0001_g7583 [Verticillium dahliae]